VAALRAAWRTWRELEAPYEAARSRLLIGLACRALGDEDAAAMELEAARAVLARLGAAPDLERLERLARPDAAGPAGLTAREREVLRLLAEGEDTRDIAGMLCFSERTVKNIVHDVLMKLNCRNRAHAVAMATRQGVI
jgi:DNA-binding NarL/FixJ family response regulator